MTKKLSPEERRQEITAAAAELFQKQGYEETSVRSIIDQLDISKGTFYHYFSSKEEVLEAVASRTLEQSLEVPRRIFSLDDLTALKKLNLYLEEISRYKEERLEEYSTLMQGMYAGDKNIRMEKKVLDYTEKQMKPLMRSLIEEGVAEGSFAVEDPGEVAGFFLKFFHIYGREIGESFIRAFQSGSEEALENLIARYKFMQRILERVMGIEKDSLVLGKVAESSLRRLWQKRDRFELSSSAAEKSTSP